MKALEPKYRAALPESFLDSGSNGAQQAWVRNEFVMIHTKVCTEFMALDNTYAKTGQEGASSYRGHTILSFIMSDDHG